MQRKLISLFLAALMIFTLIPGMAASAAVLKTGACGANATYTLYDNGELIVSGTGPTVDWDETSSEGPLFMNLSDKITKITVNSGITTIGFYLFYGLAKLKEVNLPETLKEIKSLSFCSCTTLETITFPDSLEVIREMAFNDCPMLKEVTFSDKSRLNHLEEMVFIGCPIKSFCIPPALNNLTRSKLPLTNKLETLTVHPDNPYYILENNHLLSKDRTELIYYFCINNDTAECVIPESVKRIAKYALYDYHGTIVKLHKNIEFIELNDNLNSGIEKIYVLNPNCELLPGSTYDHLRAVIIGYDGSTAEKFAKANGKTFISLNTAENIKEIPEVPATPESHGRKTYYHDIAANEYFLDFKRTKPISSPQDEKLILHYEEIIPGTPATCTETGVTDKVTCPVCGKILKDHEIIPEKGHTEEIIQSVDPTCTETGHTEGKRCSECGEVLVQPQIIQATGHREAVIPAVDPTCTETGLTEGIKCSVCGEILTAQEVIPAKGHKIEIIPAVSATCARTGLTEGKRCSECGKIIVAQEVIPALAHTEEIIPAVPATCTETGLTEGKICSVCDKVLVAQEIVPATGHKEEIIPAAAPTCTEPGHTEGKKCALCGIIILAPETIEATGHTEEILPAVAPTCTKTGLTEGKKCSVCGEILVSQTAVDALGHKDADSDGKCDVCGEQLTAPEVKPDCKHMCHSENRFIQFIWKIVNFFNKLFKINQYCECGARHW